MIPYTRKLDTIPPNGLIIPAQQSIIQRLNTTLEGIRTACVTDFPPGLAIHIGGNIYAWDGAGWQDDVNGGTVAGSTILDAEAMLVNPAGYDIGITW